MIEGFSAQPYPLWAVWIRPGQWKKPLVCRVVGWQQLDVAHGRLRPVLTLGVETAVPREGDAVSYYDSEGEAERDSQTVAEVAERLTPPNGLPKPPMDNTRRAWEGVVN